MTLEEYFDYIPTPKEKAERRASFLHAQSWSQNPKIQAIITEIQHRQNLCSTRTLH